MSDVLQISNLIQGGGAVPSEDGSRTLKSNIEQAWLRELERAQLQQIAASNTTSKASNPGERSENSTLMREQVRAKGRQTALRPETGRGPSSASSVESASGSENSWQQALGGMQRLVAKDQARAPTPTLGKAAIAVPRRSPVWEAAIESRLWSEARYWERRKAYIVEKGGRVKVWLRDAELKGSSVEETVATIRKMFHEAGMDVDEITVNGHLAFMSHSAAEQLDNSSNYRA
jgi:hypothetical protein